jgi:hypothetical protein
MCIVFRRKFIYIYIYICLFIKQHGFSDFPSSISTSIIVDREQQSFLPFGTFLSVAGQAFQCLGDSWNQPIFSVMYSCCNSCPSSNLVTCTSFGSGTFSKYLFVYKAMTVVELTEPTVWCNKIVNLHSLSYLHGLFMGGGGVVSFGITDAYTWVQCGWCQYEVFSYIVSHSSGGLFYTSSLFFILTLHTF